MAPADAKALWASADAARWAAALEGYAAAVQGLGKEGLPALDRSAAGQGCVEPPAWRRPSALPCLPALPCAEPPSTAVRPPLLPVGFWKSCPQRWPPGHSRT